MHQKNTFVTVLLWILTLVCLVATLTHWAPYQWETIPGVPFVSSICAWVLAPILIVFIIAIYFRSTSVIIGLVICLILQGYAIIPNLGGQPTTLSADTRERAADIDSAGAKPRAADNFARIMTLDVNLGKADPQEIVDVVQSRKVEVLAIQRTTDDFNNQLRNAGLNEYLPYSVSSSATGSGVTNTIYTLNAATDPSEAAIHGDAANFPAVTVEFNEGYGEIHRVRFVNVYVDAPQDVTATQWASELDEINAWAEDHDGDGTPYVVLGNFGAAAYQAHFSQILTHHLTDAGQELNRSMNFTWPSSVPMATYDHILHNEAITVGKMETTKVSGADHKAVSLIMEPNGTDVSTAGRNSSANLFTE